MLLTKSKKNVKLIVRDTIDVIRMVIMEELKRTTYVVGHKNPDTDSICSAIGYAQLKKEITGESYEARRAGLINEETHFVLEAFGAEVPKLLQNVKLQVKDMDVREVEGIGQKVSIKKAWKLMNDHNIKTLPVIENETLSGLISTGDIARSYMDEHDPYALARARTQFQNIAETIGGEIITGNGHGFLHEGRVMVGASSESVMKEMIEPADLVIVGNRLSAFECATEIGASCIVMCGNPEIPKGYVEKAKAKEIVVIRTAYDTFTSTRLINQSAPVKHYMTKGPLTTFMLEDYIDDVKEVMGSKKFRDFPVLTREGKFCGFISRRRFLNARKKKVILVDHNEKSQAVDGIEEAEIVEIIDHHRLGSIETMNPVFFRNQPVGCTATIVYQMYQEEGIVPNKVIAGLLCSAIISDTLLFRSPTCTKMDELACKQLGKIAGIDIEEFANEMFHAGSSVQDKTPEEIITSDFKVFHVENNVFGVGQISFLNESELHDIKAKVVPALEKVMAEKELHQIYFMLTNILKESTEMLCVGHGARKSLIDAFDLPDTEKRILLPGVVSRKKQLIPALVGVLQQ